MQKYIYPSKHYLHFDKKVNFTKKVKNYVEGFEKKPVHSFLPLIYGEMDIPKFRHLRESNGENLIRKNKEVPVNPKIRPVMYASHMDNFIYKHYGLQLNELYNNYAEAHNIDKSVTAYRNNKYGKSNIHFSAEVINFISQHPNCYIYVGDYEGFFENLDHQYLRKMINLLYKNNRMPEHQYKIFKNITKFAYIHKKDINEVLGSDEKIRKDKRNNYFDNFNEFREFKNSVKNGERTLKVNEDNFGIPQGTAISAIYSNIYLLEIDKYIMDIVNGFGGIYRRYSDDFIIVLPGITKNTYHSLVNEIEKKIDDITKLKLHEDKTKEIRYDNDQLLFLSTNKKTKLDYLGFVFDGKKVKIREKSIYKYYRNAYKLIAKGQIVSKKKGHIGSDARLTYKRELYRQYHSVGSYADNKYNYKKRKHGTFLDYTKKSKRVFDEVSPLTINLMEEQVKNHQNKLSKKINYAIKKLKNM